jgi:hypothetical protein
MPSMSEVAIQQCVAELRAACRRPVDAVALDALTRWLRPSFSEVLDHPDGAARWADHGQQMRDHGRHLGALADFFGYQFDVAVVGTNELMQAFTMIRTACRVGAEPAPRRSARAPFLTEIPPSDGSHSE